MDERNSSKETKKSSERNGAANAIRKRHTENDINTKIKTVRNARARRRSKQHRAKQILVNNIVHNFVDCVLARNYRPNTHFLSAKNCIITIFKWHFGCLFLLSLLLLLWRHKETESGHSHLQLLSDRCETHFATKWISVMQNRWRCCERKMSLPFHVQAHPKWTNAICTVAACDLIKDAFLLRDNGTLLRPLHRVDVSPSTMAIWMDFLRSNWLSPTMFCQCCCAIVAPVRSSSFVNSFTTLPYLLAFCWCGAIWNKSHCRRSQNNVKCCCHGYCAETMSHESLPTTQTHPVTSNIHRKSTKNTIFTSKAC